MAYKNPGAGAMPGEDADEQIDDIAKLLLDFMPGVFYLLDRDGRLRLWNRNLERATGYSGDELAVMEAVDFFASEKHERVREALAACLEEGRVAFDAPLKQAEGRSLPFLFRARRVCLDGRIRIAGSAFNAARVKKMVLERTRQRERLQRLASHVPGMIFQLRQDAGTGRFSLPYASDKIREVFEVGHDEVKQDASVLFDRIYEEDSGRVMAAVGESAANLSTFYQQFRMRPPDGAASEDGLEWVEVDSGPEGLDDGSVMWHGFARRVTGRKRLEERLARLAYSDELTGLPNRVRVNTLLTEQLETATAAREQLALLYLDLDNFKDINDAWGHSAGDRLLRRVATRLTEAVGLAGQLGRIGGDEFAVLLRGESAALQAERLAGEIRREMSAPMRLEGRQVRMTVSVGISLFPEDGASVEDLVRHADAALFKAKSGGPGNWARYSPDLTEAAHARRYLETELRDAIEREQIQVALQPVVSLKDGKTVAVEALARWHHLEDGWVSPDRFIAMAESRGLVGALGDQVYRQALAAAAMLPESVRLTVNVAPDQLRDGSFSQRLAALSEAAGIDMARLEVELTERVFMEDADEAREQIDKLRARGVSIAIDDFGAGFSSLGYLRRLPVDRLKIDRIFIHRIEKDRASAAIVRAVAGVAHELGIEVTAEGIETEAEARIVRATGCDCAQGWFFGRPKLVGEE